MRPTIAEQLGGTCTILEETIAPQVAGTPAGEVLRGLVKNLRVLETSWSSVLPFLHWDNRETAALLERSRPGLPDPLAARIGAACAAPEPDPFDVEAVQGRNDVLRALLAEVVGVVDTASPTQAEIVAHLRTRAGRYPMRVVPDMPRRAAAEQGAWNGEDE